jgi:hypothetical protein
MTFDFQTILVAITFASQILVISCLNPWRLGRLNQITMQQYPPAEYPRLYPLPADQLMRQHKLRKALRVIISIGAIGTLATCLVQRVEPYHFADIMTLTALVQWLPMFVALWQVRKLSRAMQAMPAPAVRSAELHAWRATDFVSPVVIALALIACAAPIALAGYFTLHQPPPEFASPVRRAFAAGICGLLLLRMVYVLFVPINMRRPDPYISTDDLQRARRLRYRMLFGMSLFFGPYITFVMLLGSGTLHINRLHVLIGLSLLLQLYMTLMTQLMIRAVKNRDVTPYRAEPAQGTS